MWYGLYRKLIEWLRIVVWQMRVSTRLLVVTWLECGFNHLINRELELVGIELGTHCQICYQLQTWNRGRHHTRCLYYDHRSTSWPITPMCRIINEILWKVIFAIMIVFIKAILYPQYCEGHMFPIHNMTIWKTFNKLCGRIQPHCTSGGRIPHPWMVLSHISQ